MNKQTFPKPGRGTARVCSQGSPAPPSSTCSTFLLHFSSNMSASQRGRSTGSRFLVLEDHPPDTTTHTLHQPKHKYWRIILTREHLNFQAGRKAWNPNVADWHKRGKINRVRHTLFESFLDNQQVLTGIIPTQHHSRRKRTR